MSYKNSETVKALLKTPKAKAAFNKLNALRPEWVVIAPENAGEKIYISPTIETKKVGGSLLSSLGCGWAKTADQAVISQYKALVTETKKSNTLVVVNAYQSDRREYTCNNKTLKFKKA